MAASTELKRRLVVCLGVILPAFVGAWAGMTASEIVNAHDGDGSLIHACVGKNGGIRIISANDSCRTNSTPLDWGIEGIPGPTGLQGLQGEQGQPGVPCASCVDTASLADDAVNAVKTLDETGIAYANFNQTFFGSSGTTVIENVTSLSAIAPAQGFMLVQATGVSIVGTISLGFGLDASSYVDTPIINRVDGGVHIRPEGNFAVSRVIPVEPGTNTFYLNAQAFSSGIYVESFQAIFFPTNYGN